MYRPEFSNAVQESPLPQELISLCEKGITDIQSAQNNFDNILATLDRNGVDDGVRPAYMQIMLVEQELSRHEKALKSYIS
jgi:hypothetical protein